MSKPKSAYLLTAILVMSTSLIVGLLLKKFVTPKPAGPLLEVPKVLNFGPRESGEVASIEFVIANRGSSELLINRIATSCSCSGIEQKINDSFVGVSTIKLQPFSEISARARLAVTGVPVGSVARTSIELESNDPASPITEIELLVPMVSGGIHVRGTPITLGSVVVGNKVTRSFDILDDANTPRKIRSVIADDPDLIEVQWKPLSPRAEDSQTSADRAIANVSFVLHSARPRKVRTFLHIELEGESRKPDSVEVIATVVEPIQTIPPKQVLPRRSDNRWIYSATTRFKSSDGRRFRLKAVKIPVGFTTSISPDFSDSHEFETKWNLVNPSTSPDIPKNFSLELLAEFEDRTTISMIIPHQIFGETP